MKTITSRQIGTIEERTLGFKEDWDRSLYKTMLYKRLDTLVAQGVYESEEIDSILDNLFKEHQKLLWAWGLEQDI